MRAGGQWEGLIYVCEFCPSCGHLSHFRSFPCRRRSISGQPTDLAQMALLSSQPSFVQGSLAVPRIFVHGVYLSHLQLQGQPLGQPLIGFPCCCCDAVRAANDGRLELLAVPSSGNKNYLGVTSGPTSAVSSDTGRLTDYRTTCAMPHQSSTGGCRASSP